MRHSSFWAEPSGVRRRNKLCDTNRHPSLLESLPQFFQMAAIAIAPRLHLISFAERRKTTQNGAEKPASHTLSPLPLTPTRFMPSFQSPIPSKGDMLAQPETAIDCPRAVLQNGRALSRDVRLYVLFKLIRFQQRAFDERNRFFQDGISPVTLT